MELPDLLSIPRVALSFSFIANFLYHLGPRIFSYLLTRLHQIAPDIFRQAILHSTTLDLKRPRRLFREFRHRWHLSDSPHRLDLILAETIADRPTYPIKNVVLLAIGMGGKNDVAQFAVSVQIIDRLAEQNLDIRNNVVVQDPMMRPGMRKLIEEHGYRVVDTPTAFDLIDEHTCVVAPYMPVLNFLEAIKDRPVDKLAMFVGNDVRKYFELAYGDMLGDPLLAPTNPADMKARVRRMELTADKMLDEFRCQKAAVPNRTHQGEPIRSTNGLFVELHGLDIWWRPDDLLDIDDDRDVDRKAAGETMSQREKDALEEKEEKQKNRREQREREKKQREREQRGRGQAGGEEEEGVRGGDQ